ncbi:Gaa1-like protein [Hyaloraphidium curvatum]|nr:Gaa1-like protein [Hyaloraphidium curvatum]
MPSVLSEMSRPDLDAKAAIEAQYAKQDVLLRKLARFVLGPWGWILTAVGAASLALLPLPALQKSTYVDENGLLPGQFVTDFCSRQQERFRRVQVDLKGLDGHEHLQTRYILDAFRELRLEAHSLSASFGDLQRPDNASSTREETVYAVLRAPRGDGTEALVTSVDRDCLSGGTNSLGIALLIALAASSSRRSHWSKDQVFAIFAGGSLGAQQWLDSYHQLTGPPHLSLPARAGAIQQAVHLDLCGAGDSFTSLEVTYEALNGQLPNQDIVNAAVDNARFEGFPLRLANRAGPDAQSGDNSYLNNACGLLLGMARFISGLPSSPHALFPRFRVDSVMFTPRSADDGLQRFDMCLLGQFLESTLRTHDGLLERLHHSFFFYLMPTIDRFLPISFFLPPLGLILLGMMAVVLSIWHELRPEKHPVVAHLIGPDKSLLYAGLPSPIDVPIVSALSLFFLAEAVACVTWILCRTYHTVGILVACLVAGGLTEEQNPALPAAIAAVTFAVLPLCAKKFAAEAGSDSRRLGLTVSLGTAMQAVPTLMAISLLNFPLAVLLSVAVSVAQRLSLNGRGKGLRLVAIASVGLSVPALVAASSGQSVQSGLQQLVLGYAIHGAWALPLLLLWYMPTVLLFAVGMYLM